MFQPGEREQQSAEGDHETSREGQGVQGTVEEHVVLSDDRAVPGRTIGMRSALSWCASNPLRGVPRGPGTHGREEPSMATGETGPDVTCELMASPTSGSTRVGTVGTR
jgi:hypothetical protein